MRCYSNTVVGRLALVCSHNTVEVGWCFVGERTFMALLHTIFVIFKFVFGLGALVALIGIGVGLVWFAGHIVLRYVLRHQPASCCPRLRKLFLET